MSTPDPVPASDNASDGAVSGQPTEVRVRRAPKLGIFLLLGALFGVLGTLVLTSLFPVDPRIGFGATFGYLLLFGVPIGVVLAAVVGLVIDGISRRRARTVLAERDVSSAPDEPIQD
ncbi:MAG TPA: potassium transporter Trk [Pseudolysinimonas sp.]|nr:potassium transporter Trk [Pseudolysinimonas sp.]